MPGPVWRFVSPRMEERRERNVRRRENMVAAGYSWQLLTLFTDGLRQPSSLCPARLLAGPLSLNTTDSG